MADYSHRELQAKTFAAPTWVIDPYVPAGGSVFLWGNTSIGKSPLTWHMVLAAATGTSFFGLPTSESRVLYLELDTPEISVVPRIQKLPTPPGAEDWMDRVAWVFDEHFVVPPILTQKCDTSSRLEELRLKYEPDFVVVNTARKVHSFDDKDSKTPSTIYNYFKLMFPGAATLFVHHERKQSTNPDAAEIPEESFSGSKAWTNDAQVALHLMTYRGKMGKSNLRLYHIKSQVSEKVKPLEMKLHDDGTVMSSHVFDEYRMVYEHLHKWDGEKREFDQTVGKLLGLGEATVRRRRLHIEAGKWPGSREWLGRADKDEPSAKEEEEAHHGEAAD